jgi:hypothetical protein
MDGQMASQRVQGALIALPACFLPTLKPAQLICPDSGIVHPSRKPARQSPFTATASINNIALLNRLAHSSMKISYRYLIFNKS